MYNSNRFGWDTGTLEWQAGMNLKPLDVWTGRWITALITAILTFSILVLGIVLYNTFFNYPPVIIENRDPKHLGTLCPGDYYPFTNEVQVKSEATLFYYTSVQNAEGTSNIFGTQVVHGGFPHAIPGTFEQKVPWFVPRIQPGNYSRILSITGTDGRQRSIFISNLFTIGVDCE